jgi:Tfp pilus assembly protein PilF
VPQVIMSRAFMMVVVLLGLLLAQPQERAAQLAVPDRQHAEELARAGQTAEALALFMRLVEINPSDIEARLWVARLDLRVGRVAEAESTFRAVLAEHPDDIDAGIGLGMTLTRKGAWADALAVLQRVEAAAGNNADLFAALARAYRRGGDDARALDYFRRARALAPDDPDIALGFEAVTRAYGHWIGLAGFSEWAAPGTSVTSGSIFGDLRVAPRLHLEAGVRTQHGPGYSDAIGGAGFMWRAARTTTLTVRAVGGSGNTALASRDLSAGVIHYAGRLEAGGNVRQIAFNDVDVLAISPIFAWDTDRWRLDCRYTYSRSSFHATDRVSDDHSVSLRETARLWRRASVQAAFAHGIESFEDLTADRIGLLGARTIAGGMQFDVRSLTRITGTWQHQWRSNDTETNRVTLSLVQYVP